MYNSTQRTVGFKFNFDEVVGFLYFSISNISRMLLQILRIPREASYGVFLVLLFIYFLKYLPKIRSIDIIYYLVVTPIVAYGLINYAQYIDSSSRVFAIILLFLPGFLFFRIYEKEMLVKVFIHAQYFSAIYMICYYVTTVRRISTYSMDYAYWIIVPICTLVYQYLEKKRPVDLVLAIIMLITLIIAGSRAALLLGLLCIAYYYIIREIDIQKDKRWYMRTFIMFIFALTMIANINYILTYLVHFFGQSRTIQKFLEGNLLTSSTRNRLYARVTNLINANINGIGPLASRMYIIGDPYPHSLIYECQLDYGVVLGTIISVTLIVMSALNLVYYRKGSMRLIVGYIELIGMGSLLVSSSYYYEIYVPATIALFSLAKSYQRSLEGSKEEEDNQGIALE